MQYTKALLSRSGGRATCADSLERRPVWREPTEEVKEKRVTASGSAIRAPASAGSTYLGYLRSPEVDDLPKLFGMEDRLHSLLENERQKVQKVRARAGSEV